MDNWLENLDPEIRENVYDSMRNIRAESTRLLEASRPTPGTISVGGRLQDMSMRGEALAVFLRALGNGLTPSEASEAAKMEYRLMVTNWNAKREYQVRRCEFGYDASLDTKARTLDELTSK